MFFNFIKNTKNIILEIVLIFLVIGHKEFKIHETNNKIILNNS